jgi:hypothetical protein
LDGVLEHGLLVGNRHAQARQRPARSPGQEIVDLFGRHTEGQVDRVDASRLDRSVVNDRTEAVGHRIGHDAIDTSGRRDRLVAVEVAHLTPTDLARRHHPVIVERGEREGRPVAADENPGGHADVAHAKPHGRNPGRPYQLHHPQVVCGVVGHGGDLHDIGIHGSQPLMERLEIGGRFVEIVVADDPLGAAVPWHFCGNVILQINVVSPLHDRRSQHEPAGLLRLPPAATIRRAAAGDDHGTMTFPEKPRHLHGPLDVVETEFHKSDAVFGEILVLGDDVPVPAPSDANADHVAFRRKSLVQVRRNCLSSSCRESTRDVGRP